MKVLNQKERLVRLSERLQNVTLTSDKQANGTFKIKFKDTILIDGIPNQKMEEYIIGEISSTFFRIGQKVDEYIKLTESKAEQLELELFGKNGFNENT